MSDNVLSSFTPARREDRAYGRTFRVGIIGTGWIAEATPKATSTSRMSKSWRWPT